MISADFILHGCYSKDFLSHHRIETKGSKLCASEKEEAPQNLWEEIIYVVKRVLEYLREGNSCLLTISKHLISYTNGLNLTGFSHEELENTLRNVQWINKKIKRHNQNSLLSFLHAPTLDQEISMLQTRFKETSLNTHVRHFFCFPPKEQFETLKISTLMNAWETNNEILIGILASKKLKPFGLSGQTGMELDKLLSTHSSLKGVDRSIAAVSYNYQLDPITFLADLTILAEAALSSASAPSKLHGGIFIVNTEGKTAASEKTGAFQFFCKLTDEKMKTIESSESLKFIDLLHRKKSLKPFQYSKFSDMSTVSTLEIPTTNEVTIKFDQKEYDNSIFGVITLDQIHYSQSFLEESYKKYVIGLQQTDISSALFFLNRYILATRLNRQFIILHALEKQGLFDQIPSTFDAVQYWKKGKSLLKDFDAQTTIKIEDLKELAGMQWYNTKDTSDGDLWFN